MGQLLTHPTQKLRANLLPQSLKCLRIRDSDAHVMLAVIDRSRSQSGDAPVSAEQDEQRGLTVDPQVHHDSGDAVQLGHAPRFAPDFYPPTRSLSTEATIGTIPVGQRTQR